MTVNLTEYGVGTPACGQFIVIVEHELKAFAKHVKQMKKDQRRW